MVSRIWKWLRHLGFIIGKLFYWILSVFVLGAVPILVHLSSIMLNHHRSQITELSIGYSADRYLYAFIIAMTGVTDTLVDRDRPNREGTTLALVIAALISGLGNFTAQLDSSRNLPTVFDNAATWVILATIAAYAYYKIPVLIGAARADWEAAEEAERKAVSPKIVDPPLPLLESVDPVVQPGLEK